VTDDGKIKSIIYEVWRSLELEYENTEILKSQLKEAQTEIEQLKECFKFIGVDLNKLKVYANLSFHLPGGIRWQHSSRK